MYAGIYDFEKEKSQRVIFNITIDVDAPQKIKTINDIVSYEIICKKIKGLCESKHFELLEHLAVDIIDECFKDTKIKAISLKIEKPDIINDTKSVGISIRRIRKQG